MTGDLARRDDDGYFWFEGRAGDMIKSSGYRIGPFEIESALLRHPAVAEAAVVGKPDELRGQIVKAWIVLRPGFQPGDALSEEIVQMVKNNLGGTNIRARSSSSPPAEDGNRQDPALHASRAQLRKTPCQSTNPSFPMNVAGEIHLLSGRPRRQSRFPVRHHGNRRAGQHR